MQTKEELNLADTIKGEINRMCVTNDIAELDTMALYARKNIERLQSLRYASITSDIPLKGADDYERAIEQMEHDMLYEPTYNSEDGSM